MTINVGLGSGGKAQQFAQTMAIADVQKQLVAAGKTNMVGDRELYNTAAELTRIMGHKNPDRFFCDPSAINPQTGQPLHPPPQPPAPPPDSKLLAAQARAQADQTAAGHKAQLEQQRAKADTIHQQVKIQAEMEQQKRQRSPVPGSQKARDGHHYVPDPKRPGKYLMVVHHV